MLGSEKPLLFFLTLFKIKVMSTREEKKQARIERYEAAAAKAERQSQAAYRQSQDMVSGIPMGQPILVGHHSEGRHRRLLDRSWNKLGESVRLEEKAEYYRRKAEAVASNDAIYTEDEDAEERLEQKIAMLTQLQEKRKRPIKSLLARNLLKNKRLLPSSNKVIRRKKPRHWQQAGVPFTDISASLHLRYPITTRVSATQNSGSSTYRP